MGLWFSIGLPAYLAVSLGAAFGFGRFVAAGKGSDIDPVERAEADYRAACDRGDKRAMSTTFRALYDAKHAKLADEVWGRK